MANHFISQIMIASYSVYSRVDDDGSFILFIVFIRSTFVNNNIY